MLAWPLQTLDAHESIVSIVVVVRAGDEAAFRELARELDLATPVHTVIGGASRSASEQAAFEMLTPTVEAGGLDLVLVHDGARPFVTLGLVDRVVSAAVEHGAAVPGLGPERPVYRLDGPRTAVMLDPGRLRRVQTPQGFAAAPLLSAYRRAARAGFEGVDTSEVVQHHSGLAAVVVDGDPDNIKLTTRSDLERAEAIAARFEPAG